MSDEKQKEEPQEGSSEEQFDDMEFDLSELIPDYMAGARENVTGIMDGLLELEKNPTNKETLFDIYRRAHGMKGSANMIGFIQVGEVTHILEDFLKEFYEVKGSITSAGIDVALSTMDTVQALLDGLENDQTFTMDIEPSLSAMKNFDLSAAESTTPATAPAKEEKAPPPPSPKTTKELVDSVRIRIEKADELVMLAGNLLSAKLSIKEKLAIFHRWSREKKVNKQQLIDFASDIANVSDLMGRAVDEMRNAIMEIRMLPVSTLFASFPRLVRDLSRRLNKKIEFAESGGETLMDRQIIEMMSEPLTHMIRNSIDHGIELPAKREEAGKKQTGTIHLSARNEKGKILITLKDDGGGIDPDRVKAKALSKGLISGERAEAMSDKELQMLIFEPGFSTQDQATDISGRGVGMDAVKTAVEKLQGTVEIESRKGEGTTSTIILPLTVVSTSVLVLSMRGCTFAVPSLYILTVFRKAGLETGEEGQQPVMNFRGENLPLYSMEGALFRNDIADVDETDGARSSIIILDTGTRKVAMEVGEILADKELVVKPLPENIQHAEFWIGAAQMPNGELLPVINIHTVVRYCEMAAKPS